MYGIVVSLDWGFTLVGVASFSTLQPGKCTTLRLAPGKNQAGEEDTQR